MVAAILVYQERLRRLGSVCHWLAATLSVPSSETSRASFSDVPTAACGILPRRYLPAPPGKVVGVVQSAENEWHQAKHTKQEARGTESTVEASRRAREATGVEAGQCEWTGRR
jgi:hypothetical protein